MASLVTYEDFVYPYNIDTDNANVQTLLNEICTHVEDWTTPLTSTDISESEKKELILSFSYALYLCESLRINTEIGNINISIENTQKDNTKAYTMYNNGVELFNDYVLDVANEMSYINDFGI